MPLSSAVVYIWFPVFAKQETNVGHAALYIGDPHIGKNIERNYYAYANREARHVDRGAIEHVNTNYVSWWPESDAQWLGKQPQGRNLFLESDISAEGSPPHLVYTVSGLDVANMRAEWFKIRNKTNAHYDLFRKNCSTIVLRILTAGGALKNLPTAKHLWFSNNLYVTPKNIAQICNELRNLNMAVKARSSNCPQREFMFGLC